MRRSNRSSSSTTTKSHTLPSSPTHSFTSSSSSSSFEFTALSPHKSSAALCPADELFYKGQLLPLHLSPRLSMVRTLLYSSSTSASSSDTSSRDSTASHSSSSDSYADLLHHHHPDCDSSRPSSAAADETIKCLSSTSDGDILLSRKPSKYSFSLSKISSVFRKENKNPAPSGGAAAVKRVSSTAREVLRKYLKKVKPLYEKLSQKQQQQQKTPWPAAAPPAPPPSSITQCIYSNESTKRQIRQSFSGNLSYHRRRSHISSCPSSMMSSPRHGESGLRFTQMGRAGFGPGPHDPNASSMEELQSAIQGAIAHCKNSMKMKKVSNEI